VALESEKRCQLVPIEFVHAHSDVVLQHEVQEDLLFGSVARIHERPDSCGTILPELSRRGVRVDRPHQEDVAELVASLRGSERRGSRRLYLNMDNSALGAFSTLICEVLVNRV
jgi:predicted nucleotidyltransferase